MTTKEKLEHKRTLARERKRHQRLREKSPADVPISTSPQITTGSPQGQMSTAFSKKDIRKVDPGFYELLREGIPIIDGAIDRLISFNGTIKPIGDNMEIVKLLEDFCLNVPVNDMQKGIHAFHQNFANETFEQGFSISEFVANKKRDDIQELRVADSKRIIFRKNAQNRYEPWYRSGEPKASAYTMPGSIIQQILTTTYGATVSYNGVEETLLRPENKMYFSINNENDDPYGVSALRSLDFVSQILVTMENSMKNQAERFGDPMYHVHLESTGKADLETQRKTVETNFNSIVTAKRRGASGDLVTAGGPNSKVTVEVIGHDGQILVFSEQTRHVIEQFISKFHIPSWLLGVYWPTTQGQSSLEIEAALADAKIRQFAMLPNFISLFSAFLRLRGKSWKTVTTSLEKPGDWGLIFETPNLRDSLVVAQTRFMNAQTDLMLGNTATAPLPAPGQPKGLTPPASPPPLKVRGGRGELCTCGQKELSRPKPWPELDKVEAGYETTLKGRWAELRALVFTILGLSSEKSPSPQSPPLQGGEVFGYPSPWLKPLLLVRGEGKGEGDIPGLEAFNFSDDQRAQIMQAYKNWIGTFNLDDADSTVKWYYGQAYSLGLIQAAKLIGKDRPILDIIKNQEVFNELAKNGFELVKSNTTDWFMKKALPEMQAQMLAGTNPLHVADRLASLFKDQDINWERLARTEMSMAAETAKLAEWAEWKIERVEFTPAPDACPICLAVAGDYDIGDCPIPGEDTHPRCRCSIRPAASEVDGKSFLLSFPLVGNPETEDEQKKITKNRR